MHFYYLIVNIMVTYQFVGKWLYAGNSHPSHIYLIILEISLK